VGKSATFLPSALGAPSRLLSSFPPPEPGLFSASDPCLPRDPRFLGDAGELGIDAYAFRIDEKSSGVDAGEFFHDAGQFLPDAGKFLPDAGKFFLVEKSRGIDAGTFFHDAGEFFLVEKSRGMAFIRRRPAKFP
jgi:hypothetical protein